MLRENVRPDAGGWTLQAWRDHTAIIDVERDKRYEQRFQAQAAALKLQEEYARMWQSQTNKLSGDVERLTGYASEGYGSKAGSGQAWTVLAQALPMVIAAAAVAVAVLK